MLSVVLGASWLLLLVFTCVHLLSVAIVSSLALQEHHLFISSGILNLALPAPRLAIERSFAGG